MASEYGPSKRFWYKSYPFLLNQSESSPDIRGREQRQSLLRSYLTESACKVVSQSQFPPNIFNLSFTITNVKKVDGFVRELTFAKELYKHFLGDEVAARWLHPWSGRWKIKPTSKENVPRN
jgi:hypothetical protein